MAPNQHLQQVSQHETKPRTWVFVLSCLVVALSLAVSSLLIMVTVTVQRLTDYGSLSSVQKTLYTMISTLAATIITGIISGQIVTVVLCRLDDRLMPAVLLRHSRSPSVNSMSSLWKAILKISILHLLQPRNAFIAFIVLTRSLITACITSGFTPTTATRDTSYLPEIPSGDATVFARPYDPGKVPDSAASYNHSSWIMGNGSVFYSWTGRGGSPAHEAMALSHGINIFDPEVYAYSDDGVAIHSSAIEAPYSVYVARQGNDDPLSRLLADYEWNVQNISACVPVMVRNPFKCYKGGAMDWIQNDTIMRLYSADRTCMTTKTVANVNQTEMLKWWCTHDEIGYQLCCWVQTSTITHG